MTTSDKLRLPEFMRTPQFLDFARGALPSLILFGLTIASYLLRDVFTLGALCIFFGGMAVFAWMTAWEMVGGSFRRRSIAWAAAFALTLASDHHGMKPSVYIFWVVFATTLAFAIPNDRSFRNGTESSVTLARDWFLGLMAASAAVAYAVVLPYKYVPLAILLMLSLMAGIHMAKSVAVLKSGRS